MSLSPGGRFDRYEIKSRLGAGGMGEVYLAHDTRLGRPVALKLLLPKYSNSHEHLRRFEQEARAASALNHPNILTIYEIGCFDSISFIAAEFIDGTTLRHHLTNRGRLSLHDTVHVASQVASALAIAHQAGILHRDVKPENIMLRKDGYAKLLDFGLAKLTDLKIPAGADLHDTSTVSELLTNSGAIVGTISYMSPEQLRGEHVDPRTDVWSLGCVFFEMVTGRAAFKGESVASTIVSILERPCPTLNQIGFAGEPEVEAVISKALAKDKQDRYQTSQEFLEALQGLQRFATTDDRFSFPGKPRVDTIDHATREVGRNSTPEETSPITASFLKSHRTLFIALVLLLGFTVAGALAIAWRNRHQSPKQTTLRAASQTKLVNTGDAIDAAISPDGKYVAYVVEQSGVQSLWGRQAGAVSNSWPIVRLTNERFWGLTFSRDGNYIFYIVSDITGNMYLLYRVPALGGISEKILVDVDTPVTLSPDGKQFAFVRGYPEKKQTALVIANADGSNERVIASRNSPEDFGWKGGPSWSPDGELIACAVGRYDSAMSLAAVRSKDGTEVQLSPKTWPWIGRATWLPKGDGLLIVAKELISEPAQVWHVSFPAGTASRLTTDMSSYAIKGVTVTADSAQLVAVQNNSLSSIWMIPQNGGGTPRPLSSSKSDGYNGLACAPDGRIVFASTASGSSDIWIMDANGGNRRQLTSGGSSNYQPTVTADGQYVVFVSTRAGTQELWRLSLSNGELKQITKGGLADWPHTSPDSKWVVYKSYASGKKTIWRISIDGDHPSQLTDKYSDWPSVSLDGRSIACEYWDEQPLTQAVVALIPFDGGPPFRTFKFLPITASSLNVPINVVRWARRGDEITYINGQSGVSNILSQKLTGGPPKPITHFDSDSIFWFDWTTDGRAIIASRGVVTSDVVLFGLERQE
jgi:serine/threonine protein kinase